MTATIAMLSFALLSLFGSTLAAYPYYPYQNRDIHPVNQPPQYIVYPHGVYQLANYSNNTQQVRPNDFIFGAKAPSDKLLLHSTVFKRPGIWSSYASKEITFPPPGSHIRVNITQVNAHDRGRNGTGGFVKMVRGGIGKENVTLLFRSQKNRPINFEIDIYGMARR